MTNEARNLVLNLHCVPTPQLGAPGLPQNVLTDDNGDVLTADDGTILTTDN